MYKVYARYKEGIQQLDMKKEVAQDKFVNVVNITFSESEPGKYAILNSDGLPPLIERELRKRLAPPVE